MSTARNCTSAGFGIGAFVSAFLSWALNHSIGWAFVHFFCGWIYVFYVCCFRTDEIDAIIEHIAGTPASSPAEGK